MIDQTCEVAGILFYDHCISLIPAATRG
jgi:hypothetical protein